MKPMTTSDSSKKTSQVLQNCGKCGLCLSACPVYQVVKEEQASPRAKLQLIKAFENQTLESSALLKEIISKCLMCGSCAVTCPSGINHYEKFMDMRQKMVENLGETPAIRGLIYLLSQEYRLRTGSRLGAVGQKLTPKFLKKKYTLGNIPMDRFPQLNSRPFRDSQAKIVPGNPIVRSRGKVIYFTGCATNYMFEDTGQAVVGLLTHLGYEVIIPKKQTCCAIPMLFHGAGDKAQKNIITNIQAMAGHDCDKIIVDCTTCGAALKDEYPSFIARALKENREQDEKWRPLAEQAQKISEKTTDILTFLSDHKDDLAYDPAPTPKYRIRPRAAYHAPCHSRNSFNTHAGVKSLLKDLPIIDYIPTAGETDCCGGGGTFFYEHPNIAGQMINKKILEIQAANVDLWLTDCPVCRINLAGNLDPGESIGVCHPITLVYQAVKGGTL